jgi:hypothetical protein
MIPSYFRKSVARRKLFATFEFLSEHDPVGPITKGARPDVAVQKAALDRRRTVAEYRAADRFADYFRYEREQVVEAARRGDLKVIMEPVMETGRFGAKIPTLAANGDPLASLESDLLETYEAAWGGAARAWSGWAARTSGRAVKANDWGVPIDAWLKRNAGKRITGITEATRKRIAAAIARGMDEGESTAQIADRVDRLYLDEIIPDRSMTIARTEVGVATNWAQDQVARDTDVPMEKEWLSLADDRVRDDHRDANGQRQPLDEPFVVGGDEMMFPGDESLGAGPEQIINCRCAVLHHVVEEQPWHKAARPPSPAEFARDVLGIESADVAVALAYAKGVFGEKDEWTHARKVLMKHVSRLRRAAPVEKVGWDESEHPRDPGGEGGGQFVSGGGAAGGALGVPSYSPENARRANEVREWPDKARLKYLGGSKVPLNVGEHVTVRGVYGMSEKTGVVYYNVETDNGRRVTLASRTLSKVEPGDVPAPPAAASPRKPRPEKPVVPEAPKPPEAPKLPEAPKPPKTPRLDFSAYTTPEEIRQALEAKHPRLRVKIEKSDATLKQIASVAAAADDILSSYPVLRRLRRFSVVSNATMASVSGISEKSAPWGYFMPRGRELYINAQMVAEGDRSELQRWAVDSGFHPRGCDTVRSVVAHELGHQLDHALEGFAAPKRRARWIAFKNANAADLKSVSNYSASDTSFRQGESIAEAFAQLDAKRTGYYTGGLTAGALALEKFLAERRRP